MGQTVGAATRRRIVGPMGSALGWSAARALPAIAAAVADLGRQARNSPIGLLARLLLIVSFLFMALPVLDLGMARLFADGNNGFPLQYHSDLRLLRWAQSAAINLLLAATVASLFVAAIGRPSRWLMRPYKALFLIAVFAIGPGLLVNGLLKNLFGRARPRELVEFGGKLDFTAPWQLAGGCSGNCSFTSGEAASAAAMLAIALIVPKVWRLPVLVAVAIPGLMFSLNRMAVGGHFLSDVILSWLLVGMVMLAIRTPLFAAAARIDANVTGSGISALQALRSRLSAAQPL